MLLAYIGIEPHEAVAIVAALNESGDAASAGSSSDARCPALHVAGLNPAEVRLEQMSASPTRLAAVILLWRGCDGSKIEQRQQMRPGDALGLVVWVAL